jgi:hypothetical protein
MQAMRWLCTVHTTGRPRRVAARGTLAVSSGNRLWTWTRSGRARSIAAPTARAADGDQTDSPAWRSFSTFVAPKTSSLLTSWVVTSTPAARSQRTSSSTARFSPDGTRDE